MIRRGLTLVEVTIAMGLFVVAMSMVLEGMLATRDLEAHETAQDDVAIDAARITAEIAQDLALSGWNLGTNVTLPRSGPADRAATYYPFVQMQNQGGPIGGRDAGQFDHTWRGPGTGTPGLVILPGGNIFPGVPGTPADLTTDFDQTNPLDRGRYAASFFARSQELIFVRQVMSGGWPADPRLLERPSVDFRGTVAQWRDSPRGHLQLGILYPSGWIDNRDSSGNLLGYTQRTAGVLYGRPITPAVLIEDDGTLNMQRLWEGQDPPDYTTLVPDPITGSLPPPPPVREYMYAVVPTPYGLGRLVRAYSTANAGQPIGIEPGMRISSDASMAMIVDKALSDDVVRVVFDTWRTDAALDVNDVRVRLYLARQQRADPNRIVHRLVETVIQMRAKCAELDRAGDAVATDIRGTTPGTGWMLDY